jgi:predicted transcriptional regulator
MMKTKRIKIGFKDMRAALKDFVETGEAVTRGEEVKEEAGVYFTNIEAFRKAITPRRLELLNIIKATRPGSINELASLARRNIKNVAEDMKLLAQVGLLEIKEVQNRMAPEVDYDEIDVRIAV